MWLYWQIGRGKNWFIQYLLWNNSLCVFSTMTWDAHLESSIEHCACKTKLAFAKFNTNLNTKLSLSVSSLQSYNQWVSKRHFHTKCKCRAQMFYVPMELFTPVFPLGARWRQWVDRQAVTLYVCAVCPAVSVCNCCLTHNAPSLITFDRQLQDLRASYLSGHSIWIWRTYCYRI